MKTLKASPELMAQMPSMAEMLSGFNLTDRWRPLLDSKKYYLGIDDKIYTGGHFTGVTGINTDSPWIYTNNDPSMFCDWWKDVSDVFKFIPSRCRGCWKVVARPKSLAALMQVYKSQIEMIKADNECFCKCGIERRPYVRGNYGAYWYNSSKEEGLDKLDLVKTYMYQIDPNMDVFLKRGCTEYERDYGPTDEYVQPPVAKQWEEIFKERFAMIKWEYKQSESVIQDVMWRWILFAWDRDDPTVDAFTNGKPLFMKPCVRYEREEEKKENDNQQNKS
jgi:hypothetical protein